MDTLIETIRTALLPDATNDAKVQGALACRTILAALEGDPVPQAAPAQTPPTTPTPDIGAHVRAVAAMGPDQLLEVAIAKLRAAVPDGATVRSLEPVRFPIVPIPPVRR